MYASRTVSDPVSPAPESSTKIFKMASGSSAASVPLLERMSSMPNPNAWMGDVVWVVEKYKPAESVYVRWLLGVDRQQLTNYQVLKMVHREYFAGFGKTIFPFWAGKRLLRRAELNDRDECCTRASYRDLFREKGYHASGRSSPVYQVVPQEDAWVKIPDMPTTHCCCLMLGGRNDGRSRHGGVRGEPIKSKLCINHCRVNPQLRRACLRRLPRRCCLCRQ